LKPKLFLFLILLAANLVFAQTTELKTLLDRLILQNTDYLQTLSRCQQEKAQLSIQNSANWFDLNLKHQQYDNDFTRNERENGLEHSDVDETDKRWSIELSRQLFPTDFDETRDRLSTGLNVFRYRQELKLAYYKAAAEIFDDLIGWYEADRMLPVLQSGLDILYEQNRTLEELDRQKLVDRDLLIENLEEIADREAKLNACRKKIVSYTCRYNSSIFEFTNQMQAYISLAEIPDTLAFQQNLMHEIISAGKDAGKLSRQIRRSRILSWLPEVNLSLSYNWRRTDQTWLIDDDGSLGNRTVNQTEEYPQAEIEISLPFSIFSNHSGKLALLKGYETELDYRGTEIRLAWQRFGSDRLASLDAARLELQRKQRLQQLYAENLELQRQRMKEEPSLLGGDPGLKLEQAINKLTAAQTAAKAAEMKLYREIFLINCFAQELP
jgi:hypothetical protein